MDPSANPIRAMGAPLETQSPDVRSNPPRRRFPFRFSLMTMLVVGVVVAVALGFLGREIQRRRERTALIEELSQVGAKLVQGITYEISDQGDLPVYFEGDDGFNEVCLDSADGATDEHVALLKRLDGLSAVHLTGGAFTDAALEPLGQVESLETLGLHKTSVTGSGLERFPAKERILRFGFTDGPLGQSDDPLRTIDGFSNLRTVHLIEPYLTRERVLALAKLKRLDKLFLESIRGFDADAVEALSELDQVRELRFLGTHAISLGDREAVGIAGMANLETLYDPGDALTDEGLRTLATAPRLAYLDLNSSLLTDAGIASLAGTPTLRELSFESFAATDECLIDLESLRDLRWLTVHAPISEDAARRFAENRRDCRVWWFGIDSRMETYNDGVDISSGGWFEVKPNPF